jgi:formiminotetrahydrofolate cyclodeaminase
VPLRVARIAEQVARPAQSAAASGNANAVTDAGVATLLASAACTGAAYNVRVNAKSLRDAPEALAAVQESIALAAGAQAVAAQVAQVVNAAL